MKDRVWADLTGFLVLWRNVGQANQIAGQQFVVKEPLDRGHKFENILLLALSSITNPSNLLEMWLRGVGTAKLEDSVIRGRKRLTNVFGSKQKSVEEAVATLYWLIVLKFSAEHDLHQKLSRRQLANTTRCHLRTVTDDVTFHTFDLNTKPIESDQTFSISIAQ